MITWPHHVKRGQHKIAAKSFNRLWNFAMTGWELLTSRVACIGINSWTAAVIVEAHPTVAVSRRLVWSSLAAYFFTFDNCQWRSKRLCVRLSATASWYEEIYLIQQMWWHIWQAFVCCHEGIQSPFSVNKCVICAVFRQFCFAFTLLSTRLALTA